VVLATARVYEGLRARNWMKCVIDTSAASLLERIGYLEILSEIYDKIYAPPAVFEELRPYHPTKEFVETILTPIIFKTDKDRRRFDSLVRRWSKKVDLEDVADIEVFIGYKYFTDADEALYANKEAEAKLSPYGSVRDICRLYERAEERGIFTRKKSIDFLESFLNLEPPYRPIVIKNLLEGLAEY